MLMINSIITCKYILCITLSARFFILIHYTNSMNKYYSPPRLIVSYIPKEIFIFPNIPILDDIKLILALLIGTNTLSYLNLFYKCNKIAISAHSLQIKTPLIFYMLQLFMVSFNLHITCSLAL